MPRFNSLGDRMKFYEGLTGGLEYLMPLVPGIVRLDGKSFSAAELDQLPPRHAARRDPGLVVTRSEVVELEMPPLTTVVNKVDVFFHGAEPLTATEAV